MKTLPLSEAKAKLSRLVDEVSRRDERVTITKNGKPAAILLSPEEFEGWQETVEILSDPRLMAQIRRNVRALKTAKTYTLDEIFGADG